MVLTDSVREEAVAATEPQPGLRVESLELRKKPDGVSRLKRMQQLSKQLSSGAVGKRPRMNQKAVPRDHYRHRSNLRLTWTLHFIRDSHRDGGIREQVRSHHVTARKLAAAIRYRPDCCSRFVAWMSQAVSCRDRSGPLRRNCNMCARNQWASARSIEAFNRLGLRYMLAKTSATCFPGYVRYTNHSGGSSCAAATALAMHWHWDGTRTTGARTTRKSFNRGLNECLICPG